MKDFFGANQAHAGCGMTHRSADFQIGCIAGFLTRRPISHGLPIGNRRYGRFGNPRHVPPFIAPMQVVLSCEFSHTLNFPSIDARAAQR